ncbi:hypothetical protein [uncultured Methanobrevibacter sp.]|uniref:hypothetical protein n=1 Tax=uncultured Methanobrevibacter sp. TaxID=253161 RepID=UPI0025FA4291|nr:hypothetical protein [uncultured Methanobrevibacter sp.]
MKIVVCKHCGANFQIEDDEDINTYECTVCAGDLEYDKNYSTLPSNGGTQRFNTDILTKSYNMVQCKSCGLRFRLDKTDNILDYECSSCGGQLKFLEEDLNEDIEGIHQNQKTFEEEFVKNAKQDDTAYSNPPLDDGYIYVEHEDKQEDIEVVYTDDPNYTGENINTTNNNPNNEIKDYIGPSKAINDKKKIIEENDFENNENNNIYPNTDEDLIGNVEYQSEFKVPDNLDYNELKKYILLSFAENMDHRYNKYEKNLKKKLKI